MFDRPTRTQRLDTRTRRDIQHRDNGNIICGVVELVKLDHDLWIAPDKKRYTGELNAIAAARRINFNLVG